MKKYILFALSAVLMTSCSKFLEEYSTDQRYCENVQDIEDLMIGNAFMEFNNISVYGIASLSSSNLGDRSAYNYPWLHVMDDDVEALSAGDDTQMDYSSNMMRRVESPLNMLANIHYWQPETYTSVENVVFDDYQWKKIYAHISAINSIIYNAENDVVAKDEEEAEQLKHLTGEAYFLRAYYYFYLANIYGMPYSEATAASDFCVPLKISEKIEDHYFERNTVAEVWAQIESDLKKAESILDGYTPLTAKRVGIGAVKALLSRVYLYEERYSDVEKVCADFNTLNYVVPDMNKMDSYNDSYETLNSPEIIFSMGSNTAPAVFTKMQSSWAQDASGAWVQKQVASTFRPSDELLNLYELGDLRSTFFFFDNSGSKQIRKMSQAFADAYNNYDMISDVFMIRYAEVLLNEAEALAQMGKTAEATNIVKSLRAKRISSNASSTEVIPTDAQKLVEYIRTERRRELCFEGGHRWFDLRRYAVNQKCPLDPSFTIKHKAYTYDAATGVTLCTGRYELPFCQSKDAWVLPAPNYAIEFNRGSLTNVIRQERKVINN